MGDLPLASVFYVFRAGFRLQPQAWLVASSAVVVGLAKSGVGELLCVSERDKEKQKPRDRDRER